MIEKFQAQASASIKRDIESAMEKIGNINFMKGIVDVDSVETMKNIAHQIKNSGEDIVLVMGSEVSGKANLLVMVSDSLVKSKNINAATIIKEISVEINGGGGGQPFLATAGGKNPGGLQKALDKARKLIASV
ncbi:MAG: DHHA1 domain-containing protein [Bacteroidales bacterium]